MIRQEYIAYQETSCGKKESVLNKAEEANIKNILNVVQKSNRTFSLLLQTAIRCQTQYILENGRSGEKRCIILIPQEVQGTTLSYPYSQDKRNGIHRNG